MIKYPILIMGLLAPLLLVAQYKSDITYPDTTKAIIDDLNDISVVLANSITSDDIRKHLTTLASDEYEGRETGERGNNLAAAYISSHFKKLNLPQIGADNSYYQEVAFNKSGWNKNMVRVGDIAFRHLWDYLSFSSMNEHVPYLQTDEVVYLGYGIDDERYSDYKGNNVKGKVIMIDAGEPMNKDSISYLTGTREISDWSENIFKKLETAQSHGARFVLVIQKEIQKFLSDNRKYMVGSSMNLGDGQVNPKYANHAYISPTIAREIIGRKAKKVKRWRRKNISKGRAKDIKLCPDLEITMDKKLEVLTGHNVLGYIEGTDKKNEVLVISAHYDHLGKKGKDIFNGADDNASGTSTVLEIAEAFALAKSMGHGPRRSVLCLLVTGEEKGLLGSEYYAEYPVFPIEQTIANVNIDMVGRVDEKYKENPHYIYVIGSDRLSSDLHNINEDINQKYSQLVLDYQYNDEKDPNRYYYRSDHYNFAKKGIPAIFFFNGVHEDYHRPSDTVEKINFEKMQVLGRHFFHTAWELANKEDRIEVDGLIKD